MELRESTPGGAPAELLGRIDAQPRLGWVREPSPVTVLSDLCGTLGLGWLGAKRDDLLAELCGGSKVRKLDVLLAADPYANAPEWVSSGAIGSGHLVAMTAAATKLERRLDAYVFDSEVSAGAIDNIGFVASGPSSVHYFGSRVALALRHPSVFLARTYNEKPIVPPGGTNGLGLLGMVRGAFELALQIEMGTCPPVDRILVPLGSGGTAVGLAVGLELLGAKTRVHAVSVVEHPLSSRARMRRLARLCCRSLAPLGLHADPRKVMERLLIDRNFVGQGYGIASAASKQAVERLQSLGLPLEPVYSGKAMAALLDGGAERGENVLFWVTPRRGGALPKVGDWLARLPEELRERLREPEVRSPTRRKVVLAGALGLTALAAGVGYSVSYRGRAGFVGAVLSPWQAQVIDAVAEVLLPPAEGPFDSVAPRIDHYLTCVPPGTQRDIGLALSAIEHATLAGGYLHRFTGLSLAHRTAFLNGLAKADGMRHELYRCVRDLCMLAYYQDGRAWHRLEFEGWPDLSGTPAEARDGAYRALVAARGAVPEGWVRT